jgi:hypothetical protein
MPKFQASGNQPVLSWSDIAILLGAEKEELKPPWKFYLMPM